MIGDLAYGTFPKALKHSLLNLVGEPFECLSSSDYHPWIKMIFESARVGTVLQTVGHYPLLKRLLIAMVPKSMKEKREQSLELNKEKLRRRMETGERPDLIEGLLKKKDEWVRLALFHTGCSQFLPRKRLKDYGSGRSISTDVSAEHEPGST